MTRLSEAPSCPQAVGEATGRERTRRADGSLFGSDGGGSCCAQGHGMRNGERCVGEKASIFWAWEPDLCGCSGIGGAPMGKR